MFITKKEWHIDNHLISLTHNTMSGRKKIYVDNELVKNCRHLVESYNSHLIKIKEKKYKSLHQRIQNLSRYFVKSVVTSLNFFLVPSCLYMFKM